MTEAAFSNTPLKATFQIKLNGETISIANIGPGPPIFDKSGLDRVDGIPIAAS
jgi:hypothetical protein